MTEPRDPSPLITFHEARQIVAMRYADDRLLSAENRERGARFYVSPDGFDTGTHWVVIGGAVQWIIGGDRTFAEWDSPVLSVSKATGEIVERPGHELGGRRAVRDVTDPLPV